MKRKIAAGVVCLAALSFGLVAQEHHVGEAGVTAPKVIYMVEPQYTEEARAAKVSGAVVLKMVVDESGNAESIEVSKSLDQGLDQKAIEAVRQWRFAPGAKDGKPVKLAATIEVNFKLQ